MIFIPVLFEQLFLLVEFMIVVWLLVTYVVVLCLLYEGLLDELLG